MYSRVYYITTNYMKLLKNTLMSTWDIGLIKLAVVCIGIAIGATWSNLFAPYTTLLFVVGILAGLYAGYVWMKK